MAKIHTMIPSLRCVVVVEWGWGGCNERRRWEWVL